MTIDRNPDHLHPAMRNLVRKLAMDIGAHGLALFETYRDPARQAEVLKAGRSKARPFESAHQYGLAADFAFQDDEGDWSWPDVNRREWALLHAKAERVGLHCPIEWDPGHVELPNWRTIHIP